VHDCPFRVPVATQRNSRSVTAGCRAALATLLSGHRPPLVQLQPAGPYWLSAEPQADRTAQPACLHVIPVCWRQPPGWSVFALQKDGISFAY
jgi:hypothetical protein